MPTFGASSGSGAPGSFGAGALVRPLVLAPSANSAARAAAPPPQAGQTPSPPPLLPEPLISAPSGFGFTGWPPLTASAGPAGNAVGAAGAPLGAGGVTGRSDDFALSSLHEYPRNLALGETLFALNPEFNDGTRLRAGPRAEAEFNGSHVLNDAAVVLVDLDEAAGFGKVRVGQAGDCEGWIRLRNLTRQPRRSGLPPQPLELGRRASHLTEARTASWMYGADQLVRARDFARRRGAGTAGGDGGGDGDGDGGDGSGEGAELTAAGAAGVAGVGYLLGEGHYGTAYVVDLNGSPVVVKVGIYSKINAA